MGMDRTSEKHIENQLSKISNWDELAADEQFSQMYKVYNTLPNPVTDWVLDELIDAVTFEKKLYWRRKS